MNITLKKLPQARTQATVIFDDAEVKGAEESAIKGLGKTLSLPGFRPGTAPISLLRERLSSERIREEIVHQLLPKALEDAQKKGVKPIISPRVELTNLNPLTLMITFVEKPEVKVDRKKIQTAAGKIEKENDADGTKLLEVLASHTKVDLAPELLDAEVRDLLEQHARRLEQMGSSLSQWLTETKKSPEDFLKELRPSAHKRLQIRLGMSALLEEWKITVSDEAMEEAITSLLQPLPEAERTQLRSLHKPGSRAYEQFRYQKMVEMVFTRLRSA